MNGLIVFLVVGYSIVFYVMGRIHGFENGMDEGLGVRTNRRRFLKNMNI